jgi:hypothetical protein
MTLADLQQIECPQPPSRATRSGVNGATSVLNPIPPHELHTVNRR